MGVSFVFTCQSRRLQLPVTPEKLTIQYRGNNKTTEVVALGEINILRDPKLASFSLDFLLPGDDSYPFIGKYTAPEKAVGFFQEALEDRRSMRLTVAGLNIAMRVAVESVEEARAAGDHESIRCTVAFKEYRGYAASVLYLPTTNTVAAAATTRESSLPTTSTYTVRSGDCLWDIAKKYLGSGSRYPEIAALNGIQNPNRIYPGQVFQIPAA